MRSSGLLIYKNSLELVEQLCISERKERCFSVARRRTAGNWKQACGRQGSLIRSQIDCEGSQGQEALEMLQGIVWDLRRVDFLG